MQIKTGTNSTVREKILKSAVKLLADCGIRKLAQPQIAKKAGVPQGHMTYYFPTRSDLLLAVAERSLQSIGQFLIKKAAQASPLTNQDSLSLVLPLLKDKNRTRMLIGLLVESDENPSLRKKLQEQIKFSFDLIEMSINTASDKPDKITQNQAKLLQAALMGLGLQHYLMNDNGVNEIEWSENNLRATLQQLLQLFSEAK